MYGIASEEALNYAIVSHAVAYFPLTIIGFIFFLNGSYDLNELRRVRATVRKYNCIFFNRDGTLNPDSGYISSINKFSFYNFTISSLKKIGISAIVFA